MIDDPEKTALFISRLKELLPIDAGIAKDLQRSLAAKSPEIAIPARCQVVDVLNLGDDGGVACCLDIGGPETAAVHIVSITHLLFDRRSPLTGQLSRSIGKDRSPIPAAPHECLHSGHRPKCYSQKCHAQGPALTTTARRIPPTNLLSRST